VLFTATIAEVIISGGAGRATLFVRNLLPSFVVQIGLIVVLILVFSMFFSIRERKKRIFLFFIVCDRVTDPSVSGAKESIKSSMKVFNGKVLVPSFFFARMIQDMKGRELGSHEGECGA